MPIILNTMEDVRKNVPAVFAKKPSEFMSDRYVFTPTSEIISAFDKAGWKPRRIVSQKPSKRDLSTAKHSIRFAPQSYDGLPIIKGEIIPEIQIINSHNGSCPLRLELGLFRFVCSNGAVVADSSLSQYKWRHIKIDFEEIKKLVLVAIEEFDTVVKNIKEYQKIMLTSDQQNQFASKVINMVWKDGIFEPDLLLASRREEDNSNDLFTTFNRVQENIIKGGIRYTKNPEFFTEHSRHKFATTREVRNIDKDNEINLILWGLMNQFAKTGKF